MYTQITKSKVFYSLRPQRSFWLVCPRIAIYTNAVDGLMPLCGSCYMLLTLLKVLLVSTTVFTWKFHDWCRSFLAWFSLNNIVSYFWLFIWKVNKKAWNVYFVVLTTDWVLCWVIILDNLFRKPEYCTTQY